MPFYRICVHYCIIGFTFYLFVIDKVHFERALKCFLAVTKWGSKDIYWATSFCKRQGKQKLMVRFTSEYRHPVWIGSLSKLDTFYWPPIGRGCLRNFFLSVVVFLVSTPFQQYNTIQKLIYTDLIFSAYPFIERERYPWNYTKVWWSYDIHLSMHKNTSRR